MLKPVPVFIFNHVDECLNFHLRHWLNKLNSHVAKKTDWAIVRVEVQELVQVPLLRFGFRTALNKEKSCNKSCDIPNRFLFTDLAV